MSIKTLILGYTETLERLGTLLGDYDEARDKHPRQLVKAELRVQYGDGPQETLFALSRGELDDHVKALARKRESTPILRLSVNWYIGQAFNGATLYIAP